MDKHSKYITQEQQEEFERYLTHQMTNPEKELFEARLEQDDFLKKAFLEFNTLFEIIEEDGLRSKLDVFHRSLDTVTPVKKLRTSRNKFNYSIAASITILLTLGTLWFFNSTRTSEKLYNTYYSPDPGLPTVMGENDNYDFYEAMVDYKTGNYKMAINKWEKQLLAKPENDTLNYFLGSAYLAINKQEKAIDFFETISSDSNSIFKDDSYYYMALAQIRNMRIIDAKKSLLKSNHPKSQELLLKLNSE